MGWEWRSSPTSSDDCHQCCHACVRHVFSHVTPMGCQGCNNPPDWFCHARGRCVGGASGFNLNQPHPWPVCGANG